MICDTSEPAEASLAPMQPTRSPAMVGARYARLSASLPWRASAGVHMVLCTPIAELRPLERTSPSVSANTIS
ncbi:Uncharacterised protein [Bordetella pertussis]|nr:Uncharacterised protein [Bordetella pertussis]CFW31509.1 Uncharacterised protein [Bordetella pertussis]